jgi:hypothetical protein
MRCLLLVALLACGNKPPPAPGTTGGSHGSATTITATGTACDAVRAKVADLYRAELRDRDPARVDEAVADNTTMVMNDCVKTPDASAACITAASTVQDLETRCLIPLDEEGTEGDQLAR